MSTSRKRQHRQYSDQTHLDSYLRNEQHLQGLNDAKDARIAALEALLETDELTGLPNKRKLDQIESIYQAESDANGTPFGIVYIDLDHFKRINDTFGHDIGDEVLKVFGTRLRNYFQREGDIVGRPHGDEFKVIVREATPSFENHLRTTYDRAVNGEGVVKQGDQSILINIQSSYGFKAYNPGDPEGTSKAADTAMYSTKRHRKGPVEYKRVTDAPTNT